MPFTIRPENIPGYIQELGKAMIARGHEAYLVGGCVRDLLTNKIPTDWDIVTSATPKEIQEVFPDSFYENRFGTVGVKIRDKKNEVVDIVEITPFRIEEKYSNYRHPDEVSFSKSIEDDLGRRDFTINALALNLALLNKKTGGIGEITIDESVVDLYEGIKDLSSSSIKSVGNPEDRFREDALRLLRAVRFSAQLGFVIEPETLAAIKRNAALLEKISIERIRDEFSKIIRSDHPDKGIEMLHTTGLLRYILPELELGVGIGQNRHHIYTVFQHALESLKHCPSKKLSVRLAALLHDVAKPQAKKGDGPMSTFYNHDLIGERVVYRALKRLRFPEKIAKKTALLVRHHMFHYEVGTVTPASVRRLAARVGKSNIKDLIDLRIADRLGSGCPKAKPYKLRHLEYLLERVETDPVSPKMLKVNGNDLYNKAGIERGVRMGMILDILLSEVLEDPKKNNQEHLLARARELQKEDLGALRKKARDRIEEVKIEEDRVIKRKHWVK